MNQPKYLTRIDSGATHGWILRLPIDGFRYGGIFTDGVYGGKLKARNAGIELRNRILKRYNALYLLKADPDRRENYAANTSGVLGVSYNSQDKGNNTYWYYVATTQKNRKQIKKTFMVDKLSKIEAFIRACEFRLDHSKQLVILDVTKFPCPLQTLVRRLDLEVTDYEY